MASPTICSARLVELLASSAVLGFFRLRQQSGNDGEALDKRLPGRNALKNRSAPDIDEDETPDVTEADKSARAPRY